MSNRECGYCTENNRNAVFNVFETRDKYVPVCQKHYDRYYKPFPITYEYVELMPSDIDYTADMPDTLVSFIQETLAAEGRKDYVEIENYERLSNGVIIQL